MTSKGSMTVENEALTKQVVAVEQQLVRVTKAITKGRRTRLLLVLSIVALLVAVGWIVYREMMHFKSKENVDLLLDKVKQRLNDSSERYMQELRTLTDTTSPVITKAFLEQSKQDVPQYASAFEEQRDELLRNLKVRLHEQITAHYQDAVRSHEAILKEQFPQIQDPVVLDRVSATLQQALEQMLKKYYTDELSRALEEMYESWDRFPAAESVAEGDVPLPDQLIGHLLELVTMKLSGSPDEAVTDAETGDSSDTEPDAPATADQGVLDMN